MFKNRIAIILTALLLAATALMGEVGLTAPRTSRFDVAVEIIKKYEGLHSRRHWPLVGYGHKVYPGDNIRRGTCLTQEQAEKLLRKDLAKYCAMYRQFGADSLLLAALAYNMGHGAVNRSSLYKRLKEGDRDIRELYLSYCKYRGKPLNQLKRRRTEEFDSLFTPFTDSIQSQSLLLQ